jgi:amino acid adenylation domain-containing protein
MDAEASSTTTEAPGTPGAGEVYRFPLSFAQQRLWVLDRLVPDSALYNVPRTMRLAGVLDVGALQAALAEVVRRHEVLRTQIGTDAGVPVQLILPSMDVALPVEDLSALPGSERRVRALQRATEEAAAPFDLAHGPLLRARLLRLASDEHWLLLTLHHIVTDGWSSTVLGREISQLYAANLSGAASPLPPLPIQYADFAVWQRDWLTGDALARQLAYWRPTLANLPPLELPTDRPRPAVAGAHGDRVRFTIDAALTRAIKDLARREGATLFMTLAAAFQVLLHRYSGQDDFAIGVPTAGRGKPELDPLIGFFVNTLVLRADLAGEPTFRALLGRVRQHALDAYAHQDLPFEKLVEELAPARDLSRNPLFQVLFALQNTAPVEWNLPGLEVESVDGVHIDAAKFDLTVSITEVDGVLRARFGYATAMFDAATIERMCAQYAALLASVIAAPDTPIGRLPMQTAAERARVVVEWNRTAAPYPHDTSLHRLFETVAARTPEAIAIVDGGETLTYAELDARANRLAHAIAARDLGAERAVGVCFERGAALVVAMLACAKAGAAYVPLDPELPPQRIALLLRDAGVRMIVTTTAALARLPASGFDVLCTARDAAAIASLPATRLGIDGDGSTIAYVMYTSGSSGTPKGVAIPHRAVARLVCGTDYIELGPDDVVAHVANPAFDAATFEIWGALVNGARICVIPRLVALAPAELATALARHRVTTLFLTTALFNLMARERPAAFRHCRTVLFGGEAVEPRWVAEVLAAGAPQRLLHVYGPTETTTFATAQRVDAVAADAVTIPIGRPIANTEAYVLDRYRDAVAVGVPGELCIGGPGLARGYLGNPELTAERFVAHPFSAEPGARLYRTGDRVRHRGDGAIEFLGRFDRQVKLRGHRIEPAEIESALTRLPQVRDAAVVLHGTVADDRRLTAYVVAAPGADADANVLWRELRVSLPEYMVPTAIVFLQAIPLTPNGKVDRAVLPDPTDLSQMRTGWRIPPQTLLHSTIATIWEEILGIKEVGVRDNFFDIGGHSLLAAQMIDRVNQACGASLPLTTLFAEATIEHLSNVLMGTVTGTASPIVTVNAGGTRPPMFFLHGDFVGGGFYCRRLGLALGADQPFYAVHPHGLDQPQVPPTIEAMAADRVQAIRAVRPHGPYLLGGHCNGAFVALEIARQLLAAGESVPLVVLIDARAPWKPVRLFDSAGPLRAPAAAPQKAEVPSELADAPAGLTMDKYLRAIALYKPAPYAGRVAVLRAETFRDMRPTLGWSTVSTQVDAHQLAGDHQTAMTRHSAETGACIAACIDAALRPRESR